MKTFILLCNYLFSLPKWIIELENYITNIRLIATNKKAKRCKHANFIQNYLYNGNNWNGKKHSSNARNGSSNLNGNDRNKGIYL